MSVIYKNQGVVSMVTLAVVSLLIPMTAALSNEHVLVENQTTSDVAANMTYMLNNISGVGSSYVQIKPDLCLFEVTAPWFTNKISIDTVNKGIAELYGTYLKQHPDYSGNLTLNMYTVQDGLIMNESVANEDARANYAFIDYVMVKSLTIIKMPELHDPRSEGIRTPMGY